MDGTLGFVFATVMDRRSSKLKSFWQDYRNFRQVFVSLLVIKEEMNFFVIILVQMEGKANS